MKWAIVLLAVVTLAKSDDLYTTEHDDLDIEAVIKNEDTLKSFMNCFSDKGPCDDISGHFKLWSGGTWKPTLSMASYHYIDKALPSNEFAFQYDALLKCTLSRFAWKPTDEMIKNLRKYLSYQSAEFVLFQWFKEAEDIPEAVVQACAKCTDAQKHIFKRFLETIKVKEPEGYELFKQKYDPQSKYLDNLEAAIANA